MSHSHALCGLYAITDAALQAPSELAARVRLALLGGARLIQYRDKSEDRVLRLEQARQLVSLCNAFGVALIVNDDVELARKSAAHGVHLGREDSEPAHARQQLGERAIIGVSCYNDWQRATAAAAAGADYIAFGSFFDSLTKPGVVTATLDLLQRARQQFNIPVAAIGGITPENGAGLIEAGADMLAVVQGVFATDDIQAAARRYATLFTDPSDKPETHEQQPEQT